MTLQLVEVQEGEKLLDLNQQEFHLMTGYELCVCVCVCALAVNSDRFQILRCYMLLL